MDNKLYSKFLVHQINIANWIGRYIWTVKY